jgi:hypothetical protein
LRFLRCFFTLCVHAAGWSAPLTIDRSFTENSDLIVIYTLGGGVYSPGCESNTWSFHETTAIMLHKP